MPSGGTGKVLRSAVSEASAAERHKIVRPDWLFELEGFTATSGKKGQTMTACPSISLAGRGMLELSTNGLKIRAGCKTAGPELTDQTNSMG